MCLGINQGNKGGWRVSRIGHITGGKRGGREALLDWSSLLKPELVGLFCAAIAVHFLNHSLGLQHSQDKKHHHCYSPPLGASCETDWSNLYHCNNATAWCFSLISLGHDQKVGAMAEKNLSSTILVYVTCW